MTVMCSHIKYNKAGCVLRFSANFPPTKTFNSNNLQSSLPNSCISFRCFEQTDCQFEGIAQRFPEAANSSEQSQKHEHAITFAKGAVVLKAGPHKNKEHRSQTRCGVSQFLLLGALLKLVSHLTFKEIIYFIHKGSWNILF